MRSEAKVIGLTTRAASKAICLRSGAFYVVTGKAYNQLELFETLFLADILIPSSSSIWLESCFNRA